MTWQPISTAPKDGTQLIGYDRVTAAQFGDPKAGLCLISWVEADEEEGWPAEWKVQPFCEGLDCVISETEVTHWMPLPDPPQ